MSHPVSNERGLASLLERYRPPAGHFDELIAEDGAPRPAWQELSALVGFNHSNLDAADRRVVEQIHRNGVTYNVYEAGDSAQRPWRLDVLPFAANFIDPGQATPWVPQTVVVRVVSPDGQILRLDTVRLRRRPGTGK